MLTEKPFDTDELAINLAEGETAGPPLVLLHGSTGDWHAFDEFIPTLEPGWHRFACDLRGHGKTGRATSGYLYESFVSDTVAFIERQVGKPVVLAGYSLGASTALGVAARLPGLVRALVLFDPALSFYRDSGLEALPGPRGWYTWLNQVLAAPHGLEVIAARVVTTQACVP
jgi:pimeloyl-ACP methyl ester carboxylesterase